MRGLSTLHSHAVVTQEEPQFGFTLLDLLELKCVGKDVYRNDVVFDQDRPLYGGQVAAQALAAAGLTVEAPRRPHSLHGYFLRPGRTDLPMTLEVSRDRDGRSFSARRVVALQEGEVVLSLSCSFALPEEGVDNQLDVPAAVSPPHQLTWGYRRDLPSIEMSVPEQPVEDLRWPMRMWLRCSLPLPDDPLVHACVLTYVSDLGSGLTSLMGEGMSRTTTLDHALWFHRPARLDAPVLLDLRPGSTAAGRGWYAGSVHDEQGVHVASLTQETLFRQPRPA